MVLGCGGYDERRIKASVKNMDRSKYMGGEDRAGCANDQACFDPDGLQDLAGALIDDVAFAGEVKNLRLSKQIVELKREVDKLNAELAEISL